MRAALLAMTAALLASRTALADPPAPEGEAPAPITAPAPGRPVPPPRNFSLTWSPLPVFVEAFELRAEARIAPWLGISLDGEYGGTSNVKYRSVSLQPRAYVLGSFTHGAFFGLELEYAHGTTDGANHNVGSDVDNGPVGLMTAALIGYKVITEYGLTIDCELGAHVVAVRPKALDASGHALVPVDEPRYGPLFGFGIGYSF
jgi:hypothetical protein